MKVIEVVVLNQRKKKRKHIIIGVSIALAITFVFSALISSNETRIGQVFSNSIATFEYYVVKKPIEFIGGLFEEYNSLRDVYDENKVLKDKLSQYASIEANTDVLSKEINELKESMSLEHLPSEFKTKHVSVITREAANWNDEIIIDTGSLGDVNIGMVVVDSKGIVGTVSAVTEITATITLLTQENPTSQLPIMILNGEDTIYGLLNNYNTKSNRFELTLLSDIDTLDENAKVYTSGLGGQDNAPRGIYVGEAKKLISSNNGSGKTVYVKPASDFNDLTYLSVVQQVVSDE